MVARIDVPRLVHRLVMALVALGLCAAVASSALATDVSHSDTGLTLTLPDGWSGRAGEVVSVTDDEESAWIYFWGADYQSVDKAAEGVTDELATLLEQVKQKGKAEKGEVNGLATAQVKGSAVVQGMKVNWTAIVIKGRGDRVGILLGFSDPKTWKTHTEAFEAMLQSVQLSAE